MRFLSLLGLTLLALGLAAPAGLTAAAPSAAAIDPARLTLSFDTGAIGDARAEGLAHQLSRRPATIDDPVRVASISKLAIALAVMRLVDQGAVDLDRDISDTLGWRVRSPHFPDQPITLRLLLSHQSSLTDTAGYIVPMDQPLAEYLAQPDAWDAMHPPGGFFRYANLNFPLVAAVMEAATGRRFDRIMAEELFDPLGLEACFNWSTCPEAARTRAITLYRPDGAIARDDWLGEPDQCPFVAARDGGCDLAAYALGRNGSTFSPQGGMRISARGLATIGQLLLRSGEGYLTPEAFAEMTRPQWRFDGANGDDDHGYFTAFGLGVQIIERDGRRWIGHPGEAYSLRAGLWVDRAAGKGIVRIVTGVAEDAPVGHCLEQCP